MLSGYMGVAYDNGTDADNPENIDTRHDNCFLELL